ncbi:VTT domain-containing protein [Halorubrum gandharaense]
MALVGLCAAVALAALLVSPDAALATLTWLAADPVRFAVVLLAVAVVRPFLAWPTTLVAVAVGFGYGWPGVPFGVLLLTLTALPPYYLARAGRASVLDADGERDADDEEAPAGTGRGARASASAERLVGVAGGTRTVAATRLLPLPSDAISLGAGVANVRLRPFLAGTALGELPWVVAGVAVGVSADRIVAGDLSGLDPTLLAGMAGVGILLLAGPAYRAYRDRAGWNAA